MRPRQKYAGNQQRKEDNARKKVLAKNSLFFQNNYDTSLQRALNQLSIADGALNPSTFMHYCLLGCLLSAQIITFVESIEVKQADPVNDPEQSEQSTNKNSLVAKKIKKICTSNVIKPANIPSNVPFELHRGKLIPAACVQLETTNDLAYYPECSLNLEKVKEFNLYEKESLTEKILAQRDSIACQAENEGLKLLEKTTFTPEQKSIYLDQLVRLRLIEYTYITAELTAKSKIGNCNEHAEYNTLQLFKLNHKFPTTKIKIQRVTARLDNSGHTYLLLNSDIADIEITKNPQQVKEHLRQISTGDICDTWDGEKYVGPLSKAKNLYTSAQGDWHSLIIETMSLEFDVSKLPSRAANFINKKLASWGLSNLYREQSAEENINLKMEL